jgi:hypothetical protein
LPLSPEMIPVWSTGESHCVVVCGLPKTPAVQDHERDPGRSTLLMSNHLEYRPRLIVIDIIRAAL